MNFTFCIICTWLNCFTWILTFTINACLSARAFSVFFTAFWFWRRYWGASYSIWISCVARSTNTNSSMISRGTICILCTITWINTLFISTCKCCRAIRICKAFWPPTSFIWISNVVRQTCTFWLVISYTTFGINSTLFKWTRVLAFSIDTSMH